MSSSFSFDLTTLKACHNRGRGGARKPDMMAGNIDKAALKETR
jgi:hypothetical protein